MVSVILTPVIIFISSFFRLFGGRCCRFHPTCSVYAREALATKPVLSALTYIARRLVRCQPFSSGGYDPVVAE